MNFFFYTPFANSGDKTAVPVAAQPSGDVSYTEGYTLNYAQDPSTDPLTAKDVERQKFNQQNYNITLALKELQSHAVPDFITPALNGGTAWSYSLQDWVRWFNGVETLIYESLVNSNTSDPSDTSKWKQLSSSSIPVGAMLPYDGATLPSGGWIFPDGRTIGNASSNATNRANIDTYNLFVLTWNSYSNALRPIFNSNGTTGTRGASADADWNANKAITVRDMRGYVFVGRDDMGGTAAGRVTSAGSGIDGTTIGAAGGSQTVALNSSQNGSHTHAPGTLAIDSAGAHTHAAGTLVTDSAGQHAHNLVGKTGSSSPTGLTYGGSVNAGSGTTDSNGLHSHSVTGTTASGGTHTHTVSGATDSSGTGAPHQNMQPSGVGNFIMKL